MPFSLRMTLLLSLSLHMLGLGIFEPTFGKPLERSEFARISFLGQILQAGDFSFPANYRGLAQRDGLRPLPFLKPSSPIKKKEADFAGIMPKPVKPLAALTQHRQKISFAPKVDLAVLRRRKEESSVVFHPPLPYSFLLYFQDRQVAHMEFMFYISGEGKISYIKRKISSGNLDVDLLAARYIAHYLNLLEGSFPPGAWQTVKIDLTRKNDQ